MSEICNQFFNVKDSDDIVFFYLEENYNNMVGSEDEIYAGTKIIMDDTGEYDGSPDK